MSGTAYTFDKTVLIKDFLTFIDHPVNNEKSFELLNGYITLMASPSLNHQRISLYIARKIGNYLEGNKKCEVLQDFNLFLNDKNVFRPDIMVVCDKSKLSSRGYKGIPELIIEIISKSTKNNDYHTKCSAYMKHGVKEYWLVDRLTNQILVYASKSNIVRRYTFEDKIDIKSFKDLTIDFTEISEILK